MASYNSAVLPYEDGCKHFSICGNVWAGRACALDFTKENGYDEQGRYFVEFLVDDNDRGIVAGSRILAIDPYTGKLSGLRG